MWTAGLSLFTNIDKKDAFYKLIKHPCIIALFIGSFFMFLPIEIPTFITNSIYNLSRCNITISMLIIGAILSDVDIKKIISLPVLYFTILRLVVYPLLVYFILHLFMLDPLLIKISVLMTCMPAGSTTSILANKYSCDHIFASKIIFVSTIVSIITIPVFTLLP